MTYFHIQVYPGVHRHGFPYEVQWSNPAGLPFLGAGAQGAVFQTSPATCVKVFADELDAQQEAASLLRAASASFVPQVYEVGRNYLVMEYIRGQNIKAFLAVRQALPPFLARGLLTLLYEMKRVGFTRNDTALRHVYVTPEDQIKVIDHVNSYRTVQPHPVRMLSSLENIGYLTPFIHYVQQEDPVIYAEWKHAAILP